MQIVTKYDVYDIETASLAIIGPLIIVYMSGS